MPRVTTYAVYNYVAGAPQVDRTHELIAQVDPSTKIWRYISLHRFDDLVQTSTLFFAQLKSMKNDPFEGSMAVGGFGPIVGTDLEPAFIKMYDDPMGWRSYCVVNCWHINDTEANNMWEMYLGRTTPGRVSGVAIQTTVGDLLASVHDPTQHGLFFSGAVSYEAIPTNLPLGTGFDGVQVLLFRKRPEFSHEREFRLGAYCVEAASYDRAQKEGGIRYDVDLLRLIKAVVLAPGTSHDELDRVSKMLEAANIDCPVTISITGRKTNY